MKITKLILHKYKRLFLNNITTLVYTPESPIQLILGSNGSGKSSLLSVLNPLPIDIKKKFNEGGYAEIHITKNNREFILTSGKDKAGKFSFLVDNVEKNEGGTKRAQLQLVEEYFNLTPKMNEIVLGTKTLTNMSTIERKEWFRHMSTVDYGYSITMYNKLKTRLRDVIGGIKLLNSEITKDSELLLKENEILEYKEHIKHIKKTIEQLMFNYNHKVTHTHSVEQNIATISSRLDKVLKEEYEAYSVQEIANKISLTKHEIEKIDKDIDKLNKDIDKIEYIEKNDNDEDKLLSELSNIEERISLIDRVWKDIELDKNNLKSMYETFIAIYNKLIDIVNDLSTYDNITITKDTHKELLEKVNSLSNDIKIKIGRVKTYEEEKKRLEGSLTEDNKIICDNCNHVSYFGYDKNRLKSVTESIEDLNKDIEVKSNTLDKLQKELSEVSSKIEIIKRLKLLIQDTPILYSVWSTIFNKDTLGELLSYNLLLKIEEYKSKLNNSKDYTDLVIRKNDINQKLVILKEVNKVKQDLAQSSKQEMLDKLDNLSTTKKQLLSKLEIYANIEKELHSIESLTKELHALLKEHKVLKKNEVEHIKNNAIKDIVSLLKDTLVELEEKINDNDRVVSKLTTNQKLLEEYKVKQKVLSRTVTALSPTEGLIAKSINSFINKILMEINMIINEVWSYDMKLLPCEITDENDLDYLFRVQVDNREVIDDVANLSSSMKEIVNLAFKIVFMKYSKLDYMPLILDEFGVTMDATHRHNAYNVIDNILCSNFNQIFITAHFKSMYGRFVYANVNVLDDKNIELNSDVAYNDKLSIM